MNKRFQLTLVLSLLVIFVSLLLAETLIIKVQSTNVRSNPKFYASSLAALKAGEQVEKLGGQGGWFQVKTSGGVVGWIHSSAVAVQKFDLFAIDKSMKTEASTGEVALAGKGFNKQVEESYRAKHGDVSYIWVDRMLLIKVTPSEVEEFLKEGKLSEFGGTE